MLESKLIEELEEVQVFSKRHVVLRSGLHSDMFVDIEKLFQNNVPLVNSLCCMMAEDVNKKSIPVDMVMGPAEGGKLVAKRVAIDLSTYRNEAVRFSWEEKTEEKSYTLRETDKNTLNFINVLLVDDVMTSGSSILTLTKLIADVGGFVTGVSVICNRFLIAHELELPYFYSAFDYPSNLWRKSECPICK